MRPSYQLIWSAYGRRRPYTKADMPRSRHVRRRRQRGPWSGTSGQREAAPPSGMRQNSDEPTNNASIIPARGTPVELRGEVGLPRLLGSHRVRLQPSSRVLTHPMGSPLGAGRRPATHTSRTPPPAAISTNPAIATSKLPQPSHPEFCHSPFDTREHAQNLIEVAEAVAAADLDLPLFGERHNVPTNVFQPIPTVARLLAHTGRVPAGCLFLARFTAPCRAAGPASSHFGASGGCARAEPRGHERNPRQARKDNHLG
jgi:hypothetical protein